ncbi:MAG TPA: UDP-N-acetylmuramoyl-L-alanine--D-glutamate ligase, partial [Acidimicrobiales bacterium]|nr:UDP-N-acetylmuramoyl-L-alanine--D-glutamate ligase [Acidimicrobiales bacterium]
MATDSPLTRSVAPRGWRPPAKVLVVGYRATGRAVAERLAPFGCQLTAIDDSPPGGSAEAAAALGVRLLAGPPADEIAREAAASDLVVVSPGIPPGHPAIVGAQPGTVAAEVEIGWLLSAAPIVAVTGTNGKTTVTALVAEMLSASGVDTIAAGNIGTPLIEAAPEEPGAVVVAEVSSFQLALTRYFRPAVAVHLNLHPDHLDWHGSLDAYGEAKARIFANQTEDDLAVVNGSDDAVLEAARAGRARVVEFALAGDGYHVDGGSLVTPDGSEIVRAAELRRSLPHDLLNTLAAAAAALGAGATLEGCRAAASRFQVLPHRVELVASADGVDWYDDSKATTPSAVNAALDAFASV